MFRELGPPDREGPRPGPRLRSGHRHPGVRPAVGLQLRAPADAALGRPAGRGGDDYDLYVLDPEGNVIEFAQDVQDGDDDPFEILPTPFAADMRVAVVKFRGRPRYLQRLDWDGRFEDSDDGLTAYSTTGMTRGHNRRGSRSASRGACLRAVGRHPRAGGSRQPGRALPRSVRAVLSARALHVRGPRRMFFQPNGTPIAAAGGVVRPKPDIAAADGVMTRSRRTATSTSRSSAPPPRRRTPRRSPRSRSRATRA